MLTPDGALELSDASYYRRRLADFAPPWAGFSAHVMPETMWHALRLCEYVVTTQPAYKSAIERVVSYFITRIEITGTDRSGQLKYRELLEDVLGVYQWLKSIAIDYLVYGNSFISILPAFTKYARCKSTTINKDGKKIACSFEAPLLKLLDKPDLYKPAWREGELRAYCPRCGKTGYWDIISRENVSGGGVHLKRWSPYEIEIEWSPFTHEVRHIWRIPQDLKDAIRRHDPFVIATTPDEVIKSAMKDLNIRLYPSEIFHLKEPALAGHPVRGWGLSPVLTHFRQIWLVSMFHRYNEAIAMDYIMPLRLICPEPKTSQFADPLFASDSSQLVWQLRTAIQARRYDPTTWAVFPFPVRYQFVGGEGPNLASKELMEYHRSELLESIGIPVELYRGNLAINNAPVAVRLFETSWSHLTYLLNRAIQWIVDKLSIYYGLDRVRAEILKPSVVDDINKQSLRLQLMQSGMLSKATALKELGVEDYMAELRQAIREERDVAELMEESKTILQKGQAMRQLMSMPVGATEEAQAGAAPPEMGGMGMPMAGGPPPAGAAPGAPMPGGAAPAPGGGSPVDQAMAQISLRQNNLTMDEIEQTASTLAGQLASMPLDQRISELRKLRAQNKTIHARTKEMIAEMERQAQSQAVRQMRQGGAPPQ